MPITLACPCGKPLRVGDQHAGKLVMCPVCGATQRASQPASDLHVGAEPLARATETSDDFQVLEETIPAPSTAKAAAPPVRTRVKAAAAEETSPPTTSTITGAPKKAKKRKKKPRSAGDDDDGCLDRMRENEAWLKRVVRGSAYIFVGVAILIGVGIIYSQYWEDVKEEGGKVVLGLILFGLMGLGAIGKGVIGLAFGQFLGDDD
jgi:hypothetical protein